MALEKDVLNNMSFVRPGYITTPVGALENSLFNFGNISAKI